MTLIEMLVAVALCGLIGVAGFTMLDTILRANSRAEAAMERVAALDLAFSLLRRDLLETDAGALRLNDTTLTLSEPTPLTYSLGEGTLLRTVGEPPLDQRLIRDVARVGFRVLDIASVWHLDWPNGDDPAVPAAIEMTVETGTGETATRLFHMLSGDPAQ